jgi:uncharacterized SAM-binding protein YcdF (DUF218 family)
MDKMKLQRQKRTAAVLICFGLLAFMLAAGLYVHIISFGMTADDGEADVIIVLGAAVWQSGPSPALQARVWRGSRLYHEGRADYLLCAGGLGQFPPTEAEAMAVLARSWDVEPERIMLEAQSTNTRENLINAAGIMSENGWTRALIVTDYFHMKRAATIAKDLGIEVLRAPVSVEKTHYVRSERIRYTLRECLAVMHYYLTSRFI